MNGTIRRVALWAVCAVAPLWAALHGTVTDTAGAPISDARVVLLSTGEWTVTDSAGRFDFSASSAAIGDREGFGEQRRVMREGMSLDALRGKAATVEVFALNGRRIARRAGEVSHELMRRVSPDGCGLATGIYAARARLGDRRLRGLSGSLTPLRLGRATDGGAPCAQGLGRSRVAPPDTIAVYRKGYEVVKSAVTGEDSQTVAIEPVARVIVVGTAAADYSSGNVSFVDADGFAAQTNLVSALHSDNAVFGYGGDAYVLERLGKDNLVRVGGSDRAVDYQKNLGTAVNLQEIVFVSDTKAFVTQWQDADLVIVNPTTGNTEGTVSLADYVAYAGTDSAAAVPYAGPAALWDGVVYVACQRLKTVQSQWGASFVPADTSLVVMVDAAADTLMGSIALVKKNPASMDVLNGKLYVSSSGAWDDNTDGGVEMIDLVSGANEGVVVTEEGFGGTISNIVAVSARKAYVAVGKNTADFSRFWTEIVPLALPDGEVGDAVEGIENGFGGIAYDGHYLFIGDRGQGGAGVTVIDPADDGVVAGPIDVGMPPNALAVVEMGQ